MAVVGVVALVVGIAAAVWQIAALGVVAAVLLIAFVVLLWRLVTLARAARHEIDDLTEKVTELEQDVEKQAKARNDAESQLASRIQLTAMRRATQVNALTDGATGLFSEGYFTVALDARIAAARRNLKPVAVVLIEVIEGLEDTAPKPADPVPRVREHQHDLARIGHGLSAPRRRLRPRARGHHGERRHLDGRAHPPPHDVAALRAHDVGRSRLLPGAWPHDRRGARSRRPRARHGARVAPGPHRGRDRRLLTSDLPQRTG